MKKERMLLNCGSHGDGSRVVIICTHALAGTTPSFVQAPTSDYCEGWGFMVCVVCHTAKSHNSIKLVCEKCAIGVLKAQEQAGISAN